MAVSRRLQGYQAWAHIDRDVVLFSIISPRPAPPWDLELGRKHTSLFVMPCHAPLKLILFELANLFLAIGLSPADEQFFLSIQFTFE